MENLTEAVFDYDVNQRYKYLSPRIMIGYRRLIKSNWVLEGKYGFSKKKFSGGGESLNSRDIEYGVDGTSDTRIAPFLNFNYFFSTPGRKIISTYLGDDFNQEFYIGGAKNIKNKYFHYFTIGIEGTYGNNGGPNKTRILVSQTYSSWEVLKQTIFLKTFTETVA